MTTPSLMFWAIYPSISDNCQQQLCVCAFGCLMLYFSLFMHMREKCTCMYLCVIDNTHFMVLQLHVIVTCTENCSALDLNVHVRVGTGTFKDFFIMCMF